MDEITPDALAEWGAYMAKEQTRLDLNALDELETKVKKTKVFNHDSMVAILKMVEEYETRMKHSGTAKWFTEESGYPIESLPMQKLFFDKTRDYRQVQFRASNRTSKTLSGAYAVACWSTGVYPDWWEGRVFQKPTRGWANGLTGKSTRDVVQAELVGQLGFPGTGMIPKDRIGKATAKAGTPGAIDFIQVFNDWGDASILTFKSYEEDIKSFTGVNLHYVWEDEEPPLMVHNESFARLTTESGILINTVTPIQGFTPFLMLFENTADICGRAVRTVALTDEEQAAFDAKKDRSKVIVGAGWRYDAPWLGEKEKQDLLEDTPLHLREARMTGNPSMGSGSIYPVDPESFLIDEADFQKIKGPHFKYINGLDVGWNKTAVSFLAIDPDTDTVYMYDEYYMGEQRPEVHAVAIKAKGAWIPNVIDPASRGRSQIDGNQLITLYIQAGLKIQPANNKVEAGILEVLTLMSAGKFKVVRQKCRNFLHEIAMYRRDINGKIVKEHDHACFTEQTEALTHRGWVSLKDVVDTDYVMAVNSDGEGQWELPEKVIHKNHTGKVYSINHPHLEFTATDDHQHALMTQYNWKVKKRFKMEKRTVDDLCGEMYFPNNFPIWPEGTGLFEQGVDEAYIMGMWLAEGCYRQSRPNNIVLDQKKQPFLDKIIEALDRLGWRYSREV